MEGGMSEADVISAERRAQSASQQIRPLSSGDASAAGGDGGSGEEELKAALREIARDADARVAAKIAELKARGVEFPNDLLDEYDERLADLRDVVEPPGWRDGAH